MTILTLLAMLLTVMLVASALPTRTPPPPQLIFIQASEPAGSPSTGCLPLILLVVAVTIALTLI